MHHRSVSCGLLHTCVLLEGGSVKCFGSNHGQLGLGDLANRGDLPGTMGDALPALSLGTGRTAASVMAGGWLQCMVLDRGDVKCCGSDNVNGYYGQLGYGDNITRGTAAKQMGDALPSVDLGTGLVATAFNIGESRGTGR